MKLFLKNISTLFLLLFVVSCEPDDICLDTTEDTPKLVIGFYDKLSGDLKEVTNLKIQGENNEEIYIYKTIDSIGIPLKNSTNLTVYSFTKDFNESTSNSGNEDKLYINYNYNWEYISRACGYKTNYQIEDLITENDSSNWILETEIVNNFIINEENIHVKIFH